MQIRVVIALPTISRMLGDQVSLQRPRRASHSFLFHRSYVSPHVPVVLLKIQCSIPVYHTYPISSPPTTFVNPHGRNATLQTVYEDPRGVAKAQSLN